MSKKSKTKKSKRSKRSKPKKDYYYSCSIIVNAKSEDEAETLLEEIRKIKKIDLSDYSRVFFEDEFDDEEEDEEEENED